jgi:hypothetical protein
MVALLHPALPKAPEGPQQASRLGQDWTLDSSGGGGGGGGRGEGERKAWKASDKMLIHKRVATTRRQEVRPASSNVAAAASRTPPRFHMRAAARAASMATLWRSRAALGQGYAKASLCWRLGKVGHAQ